MDWGGGELEGSAQDRALEIVLSMHFQRIPERDASRRKYVIREGVVPSSNKV